MLTCKDRVASVGDALVAQYSGRRLLVGLAGAPGSGKSTLAELLRDALNTQQPGIAEILPMDGYHYDNLVLEAKGLLPRKGSPETFDVMGLVHMLKRLIQNEEESVAVPIFDRSLELSRASARLIGRATGIIICEGNYLLLKRKPWDQVAAHFDATVMIEASQATLRARLKSRWLGYGFSEAEAEQKADSNDMPNGLVVMEDSIKADYVIANDD